MASTLDELNRLSTPVRALGFGCKEYYDLRKTLPRFYRFFEHLNKGWVKGEV